MAAARAQWAYRELIDADAWVDQYIALTEFARGRHAEIGIPSERIAVKGNTVLDPLSIGTGAGQYVLFVGRLGPEKGIKSILDAWEFLGAAAPPLKMIGEGPLAQEIASAKTARNLNIELLGARPKSSVMELMSNASMLVFASQCYEGFPLVIVESLACGTPVSGIPHWRNSGAHKRRVHRSAISTRKCRSACSECVAAVTEAPIRCQDARQLPRRIRAPSFRRTELKGFDRHLFRGIEAPRLVGKFAQQSRGYRVCADGRME